MSEPKVEFDLTNIQDNAAKWIFDQLRNWFEFREDRNAPAVQTFTGILFDDQEVNLYIPGVVYGYSGMTQNVSGYWEPMLYSVASPIGKNYFALETDNEDGNYVKVRCNSNSHELRYRATVMYRDEN